MGLGEGVTQVLDGVVMVVTGVTRRRIQVGELVHPRLHRGRVGSSRCC